MNWGHGLTISFVVFAGIMAWMVVGSFRQNVDLVTDEYYKAELEYQDRMNDIQNNTEETRITISQTTEKIALDFPSVPDEGEIHLYRPSDSRHDRHFDVPDGKTAAEIEVQGLLKGYYILKMTWTVDGKRYYQEKGVFI